MRKTTLTLVVMLLAPVFLIGVTAQTSPYDPWCDLDDDGDIDIYDVVEMAGRYGTTGDSTKNVNVTNFPTIQPDPAYKLVYLAEKLNITWSTSNVTYVHTPFINLGIVRIGGYNRMRVMINVQNYTDVGGSLVYMNEAGAELNVYAVYGEAEEVFTGFGVYWYSGDNIDLTRFELFPAAGFRETIEPSIRLEVRGMSYTPHTPIPSTITCLITVGVYLRP